MERRRFLGAMLLTTTSASLAASRDSVTVAAAAPAPSSASASSAPGMTVSKMLIGVNFDGSTNGDTFTNKIGTWVSALDANLDPTTDWVAHPDWQFTPRYGGNTTQAETYTLSFGGSCTGISDTFNQISYSSVSSGYDPKTNQTTITMKVPVGMSVNSTITVTGTKRTPTSAKGTGNTNVDMRFPGDALAGTALSPRYLAYVKPFGLIRCMNVCGANVDNTTTSFASWLGTQAPQTFLKIANSDTSKIAWACLPVRTDPAKFDAAFVKWLIANSTGPNFAFQYGNELWNGGLNGLHYLLNLVCENVKGSVSGYGQFYAIVSGTWASNVCSVEMGFDPTTFYANGRQLLLTNTLQNKGLPGIAVTVSNVTAQNAAFQGYVGQDGKLTVTSVASGSIKINAALSWGQSVDDAVRILSQASGSPGGIGVYATNAQGIGSAASPLALTAYHGTLDLTPVGATFPDGALLSKATGNNTALWDLSQPIFARLNPSGFTPCNNIFDLANRFQINRTYQFAQTMRGIVGDAAMQTTWRVIYGAQINNDGDYDLRYLSAIAGVWDLASHVWGYACAPYWGYDAPTANFNGDDVNTDATVYTVDQYAAALAADAENAYSSPWAGRGPGWYIEQRAFCCAQHNVRQISYEGGPTPENDSGGDRDPVNLGNKNAAKQSAVHAAAVTRVLAQFEASNMACFTQFTDCNEPLHDAHHLSYALDQSMEMDKVGPFRRALYDFASAPPVRAKIALPTGGTVVVPGTELICGALPGNKAQGGFRVGSSQNARFGTNNWPFQNQLWILIWCQSAGTVRLTLQYASTVAVAWQTQLNGSNVGKTVSLPTTGAMSRFVAAPALLLPGCRAGFNALGFLGNTVNGNVFEISQATFASA